MAVAREWASPRDHFDGDLDAARQSSVRSPMPAVGHASRLTFKQRLEVTARSVNLFKEIMVVDEPSRVPVEVLKSWIFVVLLFVTSVTLLAWFILTPTTRQQTLLQPTYAEYQDVASKLPTCPCSNEQVALTSAVEFNISSTAYAVFSANACSAISAVFAEAAVVFANASVAIPDRDAASLAIMHLWSLSYVCANVAAAQSNAFSNIRSTLLGTYLLSSKQLYAGVYQRILEELQGAMVGIAIQNTAMQLSAQSFFASTVDISQNATTRRPTGCTCNTGRQMPASQALSNDACSFRIAFDFRNSTAAGDPANPDYWWKCSVPTNLLTFPVALLDEPLFTLLGLAPPFDRFYFDATPGATTFKDVLDGVKDVFFGRNADGTINLSALQTTIFSTNHAAHFQACAPSSCTFTVTGPPPLPSAVTTALGTISGARGILFIVVPIVVDVILRRLGSKRSTRKALMDDRKDAITKEQSGDGLAVRGPPTSGAYSLRPLPPGPPPAVALRVAALPGAAVVNPLAAMSEQAQVSLPLAMPPGL